jgi:hypothetical protein
LKECVANKVELPEYAEIWQVWQVWKYPNQIIWS